MRVIRNHSSRNTWKSYPTNYQCHKSDAQLYGLSDGTIRTNYLETALSSVASCRTLTWGGGGSAWTDATHIRLLASGVTRRASASGGNGTTHGN